MKKHEFHFGLESEYLLLDKESGAPLCHRQLDFETLHRVLEGISLDDLPSLGGLTLDPPYRKLMPYVVEGYAVVDSDFRAYSFLPKGIEIRTPIAASIDDCLDHLRTLHGRLQTALSSAGYVAASLSHHPVEHAFQGPQNERRYDHWQWGMVAMLTYGPDINISLPSDLTSQINFTDLEAKVNYYAPALTALTVASPFYRGEPWEIDGTIGKSVRTYRRSPVAPAFELHLEEAGRIELKGFEMTWREEDFYNYFLLGLTLLLDPGLKGRASRESRIQTLGDVARLGLRAETVLARASEIIERAPGVLHEWGFATSTLESFALRLQTLWTPSDYLLELHMQGQSIPDILRRLTTLVPMEPSLDRVYARQTEHLVSDFDPIAA